MPLSIGLVGLPNAGKSTLFNSLVKKQLAKADNRPFTTIDPNIGVVDVPDERLLHLHDVITNPKFETRNSKQIQNSKALNPKIIPTTLKVVDIAGLVKNAHKGVGLGNQFLSHIREVDLVVYVIRAFKDQNVIHVANQIDPQEDLAILRLELELADVDKTDHRLSDKPSIVVINVSENQLKDHDRTLDLLRLSTGRGEVLSICAKTEAELAELFPQEQQEYLLSIGLASSSLDRLLQVAYKKLGLITFFTAGEKEVRAWTVKQGATAPEAAAKIHTDMQRGFIAADVIQWDKLAEAGGWKPAKEKGWVRLEGKGYFIQDGDVIFVRFNV